MSARKRRFATWVAALAVALQVLSPLIAQARPADATLQAPLCGVKAAGHTVKLTFGKTTPLDERSASHGEHCTICLLADGPAALDVGVRPVFPLREQNRCVFAPASPFKDPPQLSCAQPRAPPQVS